MKKNNRSFKDSFTKLEQLTTELENNDALELEQGIKIFEEGMELAQLCKTYLNQMENKIINIKTKYAKQDDKTQS